MHASEARQPLTSKKHPRDESVLEKVFSFFVGGVSPERERKRLLKAIAKKLRKKHQRLYSYRRGDLEPDLAKLFYDFYRVLGPAQIMLRSAKSSKVLKQMTIEASLTERQVEIKEGISEEAITKRAETTEAQKLAQELNEEWKEFCWDFDSSKVQEAQLRYSLIKGMLDLINFDFYYLLKRFDSSIPEGDFFYSPHFEAIGGEKIIDELKHVLEIIMTLDTKANWDELLDLLREYRQNEVVSPGDWKRLLKRLEMLQKTEVLQMVIQLIEKDPFYRPGVRISNERITDAYLSNLKVNIDLTMRTIANNRKTLKVENLARKVFGTAPKCRLSNYTESANRSFAKRTLPGYLHVEPLNYLKAFLLDFYKKDVKEVVSQLLIHGKWLTNSVSGTLSDAHQQLLIICKELLDFDASLAEDEELGIIVKNAYFKAVRSKRAMAVLSQVLNDINDTAKQLIYRGAQNCITVGKALRAALEDVGKESPELIVNWQELDMLSEVNIKGKIVAVYNKLYAFVQLIKMLVSKSD